MDLSERPVEAPRSQSRRTLASVPFLIVALVLAVVTGCEGDRGPVGPPGPEGPSSVPGPVSFLVHASSFSAEPLALAMYGVAGLPEGSAVDALAAFQGQVPTLEELLSHDVVVAFARNPAVLDSFGDRLAEYVDAGGKVILAQGAFTQGLFGGAITEAGYSPFAQEAAADRSGDLRFDTSDFPRPVHPVFRGVNLGGLIGTTAPWMSSPTLQGGATLLASFTGDVPAVALNADGSVLGINVYPSADDEDVVRLFAGALLFMAGEG